MDFIKRRICLKIRKKVSNIFKGGYPLSVSNGTSALELAIKSLGIKSGDEIIAPNFTFAASVNAIINCNVKPVLVDVEEDTWTISLDEIKKISKNESYNDGAYIWTAM